MARTKRKEPIWKVPVRDARRDLTVSVKESDIKGAKRESQTACAAANALCRQEHFKKAKVGKTTTYVQLKDGTWERYRTPKSLYIELMIFDRGGKMEATDFTLQAPKGVQRLGMHEKPKGKGGRTGKLPHPVHTIDNVRPNTPRGRAALNALLDA